MAYPLKPLVDEVRKLEKAVEFDANTTGASISVTIIFETLNGYENNSEELLNDLVQIDDDLFLGMWDIDNESDSVQVRYHLRTRKWLEDLSGPLQDDVPTTFLST